MNALLESSDILLLEDGFALLTEELDGPPPEPPVVRAVDPVPMPRPTGMGRIVYLTLTADLGGVIAQTSPRVEFADEELIEIV